MDDEPNAYSRPIPVTCEFIFRGRRCTRPVAYRWEPGSRPRSAAWLCRMCGEGAAGRFMHELIPVNPFIAER